MWEFILSVHEVGRQMTRASLVDSMFKEVDYEKAGSGVQFSCSSACFGFLCEHCGICANQDQREKDCNGLLAEGR
jgi:hypothetical protein